MNIEAVIFDWAGTTVDYGCFAPVQAFIDAFAEKGIDVEIAEVREPMGMLKRDHIKAMLEMPRINQIFKEKVGRDFTETDIDEMLEIFTAKLMETLAKGTELKPFVVETAQKVREMGIKIGATTGYTQSMLDPVAQRAEELGYKPDSSFTPGDVEGMGRPYPFMIFENLKVLGVSSVKNVIKIGDTISDIREAKNAGVRAFGVVEGSSLMGLNQTEWETLSEEEQQEKSRAVEEAFYKAGADVVVMNISEIIEFLK
ncbi:phosphonoacetaldehyde hydrolase [Lactococcus lactis subsp. lactis]|uniref:phosphonoacetaldehyde hydrolase n=1 Tax=Lactococcus lactis TaxID=1358 RepID=UPI0021AEFE50|nr:phosphonoacetaldehyde hydrolase [Lactococcus lactis]MCT0017224.1 phosphonoacetaldehyde hydrolase [Lactococcus lactis subsp. lactis]